MKEFDGTQTKPAKRSRFARLGLPRTLNFLMYCSGCFVAGSGLLIAYRLPSGSRGGHGLTALGLDRHDWGDIHLYVGLALVGLTLLHLYLHRGWLKSTLRAARGRLGWIGLGLGLALLAAPLLVPVRHDRAEGGGREEAGVGRSPASAFEGSGPLAF